MRLLAVIWFIAVLLQAFSKNLIILDYHLNIKYISTHLCVNRNHPELHCEGKCFLKKQLEKDQHRNPAGVPAGKFAPDIPFCDCHFRLLVPVFTSQPFQFLHFVPFYLTGIPSHIFHPPATC
ncbi:MAG: hypothetical protein IRZ01_05775 [Thermoflavifilum aggregans]|nr:hypothetical protein [Thermoflavifilum aggregans]